MVLIRCKWAVGLITCLATLSLVSCGRTRPTTAGAAGQPGKPVAVRVARVAVEDIERRVEVVGTLQAFEEVTVSSDVEGRITEVLSDLGDRVRRGQKLAVIHPEEQQYVVDQQQAQLRQALDRLGLKNENDRVMDINEVPEVRKAAADLFEAEQRYKRVRELVAQQIASPQDLDQADARFRSTQANLDYTVRQAQNLVSQVAQFKASLDLARKRLRDTVIEAPFDGSIRERLVHPGQYVKQDTALYQLVNADPLRLRVEVPERMAPWINAGSDVEVAVEAHPGRVFHGKVSRISPAVDEQKRTFAIEALIPNGQSILKPGFYSKATIQTHKHEQVITIPPGAVMYAYGTNRAFVIDAGKASAREVKLGERVGNKVEVVEGLKGGEQIAITEVEKLDSGTPVVVQEK